MKKVPVYDEETGYQNEIESVFNPKGPKQRIHHRYRSHITKWKGVNTQFCIVCREGGEILCCEGCPASFHLLCHTPPIIRSAIPSGKWFCHRCTQLPKELAKTNIAENPEETEVDRNEMATNFVLASASERERDNALRLLTAATKVRNTEHFALPDEIDPKIPMPHSDLSKPRGNVTGKCCTKCGKIKDKVAMIECDYCIAPYHLDCLSTPMTVPAKSRWMCPQHPEHVVDKWLLQSSSLSHRLKMWNKHASLEVDPLESQYRFVLATREEAARHGGRPKEKRVAVPIQVKKFYNESVDGDDKELFFSRHSRDEWVQEMARMQASVAALKYGAGIESDESTTPARSLKEVCQRQLRDRQARHEHRLMAALALQRIQTMEAESAAVLTDDKHLRSSINKNLIKSGRHILAVLGREGHAGSAVPIQSMVTNIGSGEEMDIRIPTTCRAFAPCHATFVFDKVSQHFELLPAGVEVVRVDGIEYGIDVDAVPPYRLQQCHEVLEDVKMEEPSSPPPEDGGQRSTISTEDTVAMRKGGEEEAQLFDEDCILGCRCTRRRRIGSVSQAAPLKHGSTIEIGCERFVFASFF